MVSIRDTRYHSFEPSIPVSSLHQPCVSETIIYLKRAIWQLQAMFYTSLLSVSQMNIRQPSSVYFNPDGRTKLSPLDRFFFHC